MRRLIFMGLALLLGGTSVMADGDASNTQEASTAKAAAMGTAAMGADGMMMSSSIDLNDSMNQEGSGTAWLPGSTPMYGKMVMQPNGDMLMVHGAAMPRYTDVSSKRGDRRFDAPNWIMGMFSHPLTERSQLGLRAMFSLDPVTEGGYGYPLLFQTGESWHHRPLHDRQHPHDLVDELSATYSRLIGGGNSAYVYLGYPGEPALGPPTYMHRLIAYDLADAPIGHHWQDATHVTFGVLTTGLNFGRKIKFEASNFTGREPDENRYSFDKPRFDSYSGRLSYNLDADNAFQISYGLVKNPEGDGANVHRTTASWLYNRPLGPDANLTTALVWGQNDLTQEGKTNSYLAEVDYQRAADTFFARIENIQKSGHELVLPAASLLEQKFTLGEYTAGYVRDITHGKGIDTGLGAAVTVNTKPSALDPFYGAGVPVSFQIFLRFRPSRMQMGMQQMEMKQRTSQKMGDDSSSAMSSAMAAAQVSVSLAPDPPKAHDNNQMIVTLHDANGAPILGASVTASVAMTTMDMGTSHPAFQELGAGRYQGNITFSMSGSWRVSVAITLPKGGGKVTKTFDYQAGH